MIKKYAILFFLGLSAVPAFSQEIVKHLGWKTASMPVLIGIVLLFAAGITAFVIIILRKDKQVRQVTEQHDEAIFAQGVQKAGLTDGEVARLKQLLLFDTVSQPQVILQSISLFERCVDAEINRLKKKGISEDERKLEDNHLRAIRKKLGFHHLPFEHPLVSTRNITIGQVGSVFGKNPRNPLIHKVVLVDNNEFFFTVQYRVDKEDLNTISVGDTIRFAFTRQSDGMYGIALPVARKRNGVIDLYHTLDIKRNQLRQYVRIEASGEIRYKLLKTADPEKSELKRGQIASGKMIDISGGGMSFIAPISLKPGDLLALTFILQGENFTSIVGQVVRISLQEGKTERFFRHHIQFVSMDHTKREKIIRQVFERQRHLNQWR